MTILTDLGSENISYYAPMFPKGILDEIASDEHMLMFGIEYGGVACGVVAVRALRPEASILWYYVDPDYRGFGVGREAFFELCRMMYYRYSMDSVSMELSSESDPKLKRMFMSFEGAYTETLPECRFITTVGWLRSSERLIKAAGEKNKLKSVPLSSVSDYEVTNFSRELRAAGMDYIEFPIDREGFLKDASAVYEESGKPVGILLLKRKGQEFEIPYMASLSTNPLAVMDMVCFTRNASERFSDDSTISMNLVEDRLVKLIKGLLDMSDDENDGFSYNKKLILPLAFVEEGRQELLRTNDLWDDLINTDISEMTWAE